GACRSRTCGKATWSSGWSCALGPAGAWRGRRGGQHLAGPRLADHVVHAPPLGWKRVLRSGPPSMQAKQPRSSPYVTVGQASVSGDVEGGEPVAVGLGDD